MIKVRQTPHQSPMLKMLEDKFLQSAPDTQAYNTLVKAHMEWLCKYLILDLQPWSFAYKRLLEKFCMTGVDILQKKAKNALRCKNSAPAKFPQPSKISKIK